MSQMKRMEELPRSSIPVHSDPCVWWSNKPPSLISSVVFTSLIIRISFPASDITILKFSSPDGKISVVPPHKTSKIDLTLIQPSVPRIGAHSATHIDIYCVSTICLQLVVLAGACSVNATRHSYARRTWLSEGSDRKTCRHCRE